MQVLVVVEQARLASEASREASLPVSLCPLRVTPAEWEGTAVISGVVPNGDSLSESRVSNRSHTLGAVLMGHDLAGASRSRGSPLILSDCL